MIRLNKKQSPEAIFLQYSVFTSTFMTMVFTVNLIYFVTVLELDPLQMVLVGTTLELSIFLFEIPTGVVADTISRRTSIIIGVFLIGIGFVVQATFQSFVFILIAQVIWGLGYTFTSGATQAWITDEIGEDQAGSAFLHAAQLEQVGALIAIGLSVLFSSIWGMRIPMLLGGLFFWMLGFYLLIWMPENGFTGKSTSVKTSLEGFIQTIKAGWKTVKIHPVLWRILLIGFFFGFYSEGLDRLSVPHLIEKFNLPDLGEGTMVGWFGGLSAIGMVLTFFSAGLLRKYLGKQIPVIQLTRFLALFSAGLVISLVVFPIANQMLFSFSVLLLIGVFRSLIYPLYNAWINQNIPSETRATIVSLSSLVDATGQIGGGPLVGVIARQYSIQAGLLTSAFLLSPVLILFAILYSTKIDGGSSSLIFPNQSG
jgi:DHA3 family tetracycline resistance protein-like MFS transporter